MWCLLLRTLAALLVFVYLLHLTPVPVNTVLLYRTDIIGSIALELAAHFFSIDSNEDTRRPTSCLVARSLAGLGILNSKNLKARHVDNAVTCRTQSTRRNREAGSGAPRMKEGQGGKGDLTLIGGSDMR